MVHGKERTLPSAWYFKTFDGLLLDFTLSSSQIFADEALEAESDSPTNSFLSAKSNASKPTVREDISKQPTGPKRAGTSPNTPALGSAEGTAFSRASSPDVDGFNRS